MIVNSDAPHHEGKLRAIASQCRSFLESIWPTWHTQGDGPPPVLSAGTCGRSSLFLHRVLTQDHSISARWVTGCPFDDLGRPHAAGFDAGGEWHGHSWVLAGRWIVDITADQFGLEPVLITHAEDARYRSSADLALSEFKERRLEAIERLWPDWRMHAQVQNLQVLHVSH